MELEVKIGSIGSTEECDLFKGQWVSNPLGPSYTNNTCNFIDDTSNCLKNGRPDTGYLYWKWKPYDCELPPLDADKFMKSMRDKSWAFIGDSILRNQMQSLTCILSKVEEPVETYHDETSKSRTFYFPSHNFTLATIWAPFLVKYRENDNIANSIRNKEFQVYLDTLEEKWTQSYHKYDYIVIASGQWYLKSIILWEDGKIVGCHNCAEKSIKEIGVEHPYRRSLKTAFNFITSSDHKPLVFFRTWMPDHFEYGEWFSGGICNRTRPYKEGEYNGKEFDQVMRDVEVDEFAKVVEVASERGTHIKLLDTFHLSLLRPDGHPGPYRHYPPSDTNKTAKIQNDCLHSCLPGPIDTWNDLTMKIMVDGGAIKSSSHMFVI
ncbi:protein trichome birefringence-like 26 isoform X2 [Asparagus officinalis]|nr:protein trichome birefringence-like 26 isoform X2 [Asparagus officinalis]